MQRDWAILKKIVIWTRYGAEVAYALEFYAISLLDSGGVHFRGLRKQHDHRS